MFYIDANGSKLSSAYGLVNSDLVVDVYNLAGLFLDLFKPN
jgi:hypothetical protein